MSFRQCPECEATVDAAKAYCPDCGTPMDEEQKRVGSSEFDSSGKTQRLSKTTQFRLMEQLNLSSFFAPPQMGEKESKAVETDVKVVQPSGRQQAQIKPIQPETAAKPKNVINLTAEKDRKTGDASNPNKRLYFILGGIILLFFGLAFIVIIFGFLYLNYFKQGSLP